MIGQAYHGCRTGDLATSSPESYTVEEMRAISDGMDASTAEAEAAMRADFWSMPADARGRMMELLGASGCETQAWWEDVLGVLGTDPRRVVS